MGYIHNNLRTISTPVTPTFLNKIESGSIEKRSRMWSGTVGYPLGQKKQSREIKRLGGENIYNAENRSFAVTGSMRTIIDDVLKDFSGIFKKETEYYGPELVKDAFIRLICNRNKIKESVPKKPGYALYRAIIPKLNDDGKESNVGMAMEVYAKIRGGAIKDISPFVVDKNDKTSPEKCLF